MTTREMIARLNAAELVPSVLDRPRDEPSRPMKPGTLAELDRVTASYDELRDWRDGQPDYDDE